MDILDLAILSITLLIPVRMPHPCRAPDPRSTELQRDPQQSFFCNFLVFRDFEEKRS